jgi:hypothetical protein
MSVLEHIKAFLASETKNTQGLELGTVEKKGASINSLSFFAYSDTFLSFDHFPSTLSFFLSFSSSSCHSQGSLSRWIVHSLAGVPVCRLFFVFC